MAGLGGRAHQALIEQVVAHYAGDGRIRRELARAGAAYDLGPRRRAVLGRAELSQAEGLLAGRAGAGP